MKSKKLNKAWLHDHLNDPYVKMAQREGYRARAAYKLKEIDETHSLLRPGQVVVDLGACPGAWSQYVRRRFAPAGAAVGELEAADAVFDGTGEGAADVAEELAFEEFAWDGSAIDLDEGFAGAGAALVDGAGDEFFAGAALAEDEDVGFGICDDFDLTEGGGEGGACA